MEMCKKAKKVKDERLWEVVNRKKKELETARFKKRNGGESIEFGISGKEMEVTLEKYDYMNFKEKALAVTLTENTKGYCPYCLKRPIDHDLLDILDSPYCGLCAVYLANNPQKKKEFIEKKSLEIQALKA